MGDRAGGQGLALREVSAGQFSAARRFRRGARRGDVRDVRQLDFAAIRRDSLPWPNSMAEDSRYWCLLAWPDP